jgi:hypothetical protein
MKAILVLALLAVAAFAVSEATVSSTQRSALVDLYKGTHGESWTKNTNWLADDPCTNQWAGVTCDSTGANILRIELPLNRLSGTLSSSLSALTACESLYFKNNKLSGTVPTSISNLPLTSLHLEQNLLSGSLNFIGNWSDMNYLYLSDNAFTGAVPDAFYSYSKLKWIDLSFNALSGSLPKSMVYLTNAEFVDLSDNAFTGVLYDGSNLTASIFDLPQVNEFYVENNHFTGVLPAELPSWNKMKYYFANGNQLSGVIPSWVCNMISYNLQSNRFNCPLPSCCQQECDRGYIKCCGTCA